MHFDAIFHYTLYAVVLVCVPLTAGVAYYMLVLHQAVRNEERLAELRRYEGKRRNRLRKMAEAKRLADPFFHFNINKSKTIDEMVEEQLATERGTMVRSKRDMKIQRAIEEGRLVLLETPIGDCAAGMVIGAPLEQVGVPRGAELTDELIQHLKEHGVTEVPVLYNPSRVIGQMTGRAA